MERHGEAWLQQLEKFQVRLQEIYITLALGYLKVENKKNSVMYLKKYFSYMTSFNVFILNYATLYDF